MIDFEWPWLSLLLPLPLLVRYVMQPRKKMEKVALRMPFLADFIDTNNSHLKRVNSSWLLWLATFGWCLLVLASMRPQWLNDLVEIPVSGRDLMLAVDLSGSMLEKDFSIDGQQVDRLTATKSVAGEFISKRTGDYIGLILFGERAFLQTPLTLDRKTVRILLDESVIGMAGKTTAIGDAIGLAVKRLRKRDKDTHRVLILLTDGENTAGTMEPLTAADIAASEGLVIYTIALGPDGIWVKNNKGKRSVEPGRILAAIAEKTNGQYFRARNTAEFQNIYKTLDKLEPLEKERLKFRPSKALYYWPLSISSIIASLIIILRLRGLE